MLEILDVKKRVEAVIRAELAKTHRAWVARGRKGRGPSSEHTTEAFHKAKQVLKDEGIFIGVRRSNNLEVQPDRHAPYLLFECMLEDKKIRRWILIGEHRTKPVIPVAAVERASDDNPSFIDHCSTEPDLVSFLESPVLQMREAYRHNKRMFCLEHGYDPDMHPNEYLHERRRRP